MRHRGFTLIELSIVLVIIGLVIGSVVIGQDMLKAAKIRKMFTEIEQLNTAFGTFKLKYAAIPGDMSNATSVVDPSCVVNVASASICNGDGNNQIDGGIYNFGAAETVLAYRHLALAKLIPGSYTGDFTSPYQQQGFIAGVNVMASSIEGFAYLIRWQQISPYVAAEFNGHVLTMGNPVADGGYYLQRNQKVFSSNQAYLIDSKADDGRPRDGIIRASAEDNSDAAAAYCYNPATLTYWAKDTGYDNYNDCLLGFKMSN